MIGFSVHHNFDAALFDHEQAERSAVIVSTLCSQEAAIPAPEGGTIVEKSRVRKNLCAGWPN